MGKPQTHRGSSTPDRYKIRAVERALILLKSFLSEDSQLGASEISKEIGLDRATTFRLLVTLESQGFVQHDPTTGRYRLGVACLELGNQYLKGNDLRLAAHSILEELRDEFGETVHLAILEDTEVVYLEKLAGLHPIGLMSSRVGLRAPSYCTGVGKALLAFQPNDELVKRLPQIRLTAYTDSTITDLDMLRAELAGIQQKGYAIDCQEHELGVECVAAPIFDDNGVVAAMSVSGPFERIEQEIKIGILIPRLMQTASQISRQIGSRHLLTLT